MNNASTRQPGTGQDRRSPARIVQLIPMAILVSSVAAGMLVLWLEARASAQLKERIRTENRMRLDSTREHAEDYFDAVHSTLLVISLDDNVQAIRRGSEDFIQRLYDYQWERYRLSEIYIVEAEFPGNRRPFLTFEHGEAGGESKQALHSQDREAQEYQVQMEQIRRFTAQPNLQALISPEIDLCVNELSGARARGVVYSVPIRTPEGLAGIVAAMVPTQVLRNVLGHEAPGGRALLVNERGEFYEDRAAGLEREWFRQQFSSQTPERFFSAGNEAMVLGDQVAVWSPVKVVSADKWWLVYLYDKNAALEQAVFLSGPARLALPAALVLLGLALAMVARGSSRLMEQELGHLRQQEILEQEVQAVSEREQRRIGQELHEDLCQRLAGTAAAFAALQKKSLKSAGPSELTQTIAEELRDSLSRARELADELQPVSLLSEGFVAAMETLAARTQQRGNVQCVLEIDDFPDVEDPVLGTHLHRIAQEAVGNAVQHAEASEIRIHLWADPGHLVVEVKDNGKGLPAGANTTTPSGMGLKIMRYRSSRIHATLEIEPASGGGTVVRCRCPRPPADSAEQSSK